MTVNTLEKKKYNAVCSVFKKGGTGIVDSHGFESQAYALLLADIKCYMENGAGKELDTDAAFGIQYHTFFTPALYIDDPETGTRPLNIHDWLQLNKFTDMNGVERIVIDPPDPDGPMFDVVNIKNPGLLNHHWEIETKFIEP